MRYVDRHLSKCGTAIVVGRSFFLRAAEQQPSARVLPAIIRRHAAVFVRAIFAGILYTVIVSSVLLRAAILRSALVGTPVEQFFDAVVIASEQQRREQSEERTGIESHDGLRMREGVDRHLQPVGSKYDEGHREEHRRHGPA